MATNSIPLDPWQNPLGTGLSTVPASKVSEAAEVIRGIAGSWAASYVLDPGLREDNVNTDNRYPNPQQLKISKLGQPGHPEINFAPYSFRTNRFGNKGGSLIGHPISFEVVGPTLKSSGYTGNGGDAYWFWTATSNTGTTGDYLDLVSGGTTVDDLYATGLLSSHAGGLYVIISQTAQDGPFVGGGGIGDGGLKDVPATAPLEPITEASKFEIFRVTAINGARLTLDYTKRLSTYFTFPDDPDGTIRAITLIRPKATRLVAIPEPGVTKGHEKTFAVVSPARALNTDEQYTYQIWTSNPTWTEYWLRDAGGSSFDMLQGRAYEYQNQPALPVPRPKGKAVFYLPSTDTVTTASWMGLWETSTDADVGDIIHVYDVRKKGVAQLKVNGANRGVGLNALLGWFEVMSRAGGKTYVRRYGEVDPETGRTFAGSSSALLATATTATNRIQLHATVHSPVKSLWTNSTTGNYFDIDAVNSARLTNIIDPTWTERSTKGARASAGFNPARADRAVFDTRGTGSAGGNADPGSLMDLGFRMVLFPAKSGTEADPAGGPAISITIPDWSRPITSNELILDPSVRDERQYVDIDYANGIIRFSHSPQSGSDVWPTSTGTDNPRGELVLFACCVPYSMEEGQLGSGFRATSSTSSPIDCVPGLNQGSPDQADVYSSRMVLAISESPAQVIGSARNGALASLTLQGWVADRIPLSGVIEILQGSTPAGDPVVTGTSGGAACRGSLYGYDGLEEALVGPTQVTYLYRVYGGGDAADTFTVDVNNPAVAVWRREFLTPQDAEGLVGVDYQYDTTYGSAKRSTAVRFEYSDLKANEDGTISVLSKDPVTASHRELFNDLYRSWLISGGTMGAHTVGIGVVNIPIAEAVILKDGVRQIVPATEVSFASFAPSTHYVKYTGDGKVECVTCTAETTLPLDSPEDILLGMVEVTIGPLTVTRTDLRNPLLDVNQRMDIYVGIPSRSWVSYQPHFSRMSDAINFANEMGNPTAGVGVQQIRIFVVGPVDQDDEYPIVIKTDGIVIESAAKTDDTNHPEVCWGSASKPSGRDPLFDLNGHSNFVLRNVAFRFLWDLVTPVPPTAADANGAFVVRATGGNSSNVIIDNCRLMGLADGLVTSGTAVGAWTLDRWQITRNTAPTLLTAGVFALLGITHTVIADNLFWQDANTDAWVVADILDGILLSNPGTNSAAYNTVERNDISRFRAGILGYGSLLRVHHNTLATTRQAGITLSGGDFEVVGNYLLDVYQDVPLGTVWRDGIYCVQSNPVFAGYSSTRVEGNVVQMPTGWAPAAGTKGAAIHLFGFNFIARGNRAIRLDADQDDAPCVLVGTYSLIEGDNSFWIIWGLGNRVTGCTMHHLDVNFDRYGWFGALNGVVDFNNNVDGNTFTRTYTGSTATNGGVVLGGLTQVSNNYFNLGGPTSASTGRGLYVCTGCSLVNNDILHLKDMVSWFGGPNMSTVSLTGNIIRHFGETALGAEDGILEGSDQSWVNNLLSNSGAALSVTISGSGSLFRGNRFMSPGGASTMTLLGNYALLSENSFGPGKASLTVQVVGDRGRVAGNTFTDDGPTVTLTVTGKDCIMEGNVLGGNLTATPGDDGTVIISGNRVLASGATGYLRINFSGADAPHAIITGNWVDNDIQYYNTGLAAAANPPAASHWVLQGNRATNVFKPGNPAVAPVAAVYPATPENDNIN